MSEGAWNTTARSGPAFATSRPSNTIPPREMPVRPAVIDKTVDFPQPEWPISEMNSPLSISRLKPSTTVSGPLGVGYILVTLKNSRYRSEEHTSELQSLMRISYAVFCLKKKIKDITIIKNPPLSDIQEAVLSLTHDTD